MSHCPDSPQSMLSRQWSASTLLRGNSYLMEQHETNKSLTYDDILKVSRSQFLQTCKTYSLHVKNASIVNMKMLSETKAAKGQLASLQAARASTPTPTPKRSLFSPNGADANSTLKDSPEPAADQARKSPTLETLAYVPQTKGLPKATPAPSPVNSNGKTLADEEDCKTS